MSFLLITLIFTIAQPKVSMSHVRASDGVHTILCLSEGFYPSALEQMWMRNGGFQNDNINKTNPDGSFTLHSYLNVSDCTDYSCWVNHSSLSQPMILHLSPADCYENRGAGSNKYQSVTQANIFTNYLNFYAIIVLCFSISLFHRYNNVDGSGDLCAADSCHTDHHSHVWAFK